MLNIFVIPFCMLQAEFLYQKIGMQFIQKFEKLKLKFGSAANKEPLNLSVTPITVPNICR